jgi:hypothetical protein
VNKIGTDFSSLSAYDINLDYNQAQLINLKEQIHGLLSLNIDWPESLVTTPLVEVVERRPTSLVKTQPILYNTCSSTFYGRPKSIGRPLKEVVLLDGNSRIIIDNKPKISVVSGKMSQSFDGHHGHHGHPGLLLKNSRRTMIFPV